MEVHPTFLTHSQKGSSLQSLLSNSSQSLGDDTGDLVGLLVGKRLATGDRVGESTGLATGDRVGLLLGLDVGEELPEPICISA